MLDVDECFEVPRGEQTNECTLLIGEGIGHEALIVFDEVGNACDGTLFIDGERGVINANKRVPVGARLTLYLLMFYPALV